MKMVPSLPGEHLCKVAVRSIQSSEFSDDNRSGSLNDLLAAQDFLDTDYLDRVIKHLNKQLAQDPAVKGRNLEGIASSIDVMLDAEQLEKVEKVKQKLKDKVEKLKSGQTYEGEDL
jgi:hypothetical protein